MAATEDELSELRRRVYGPTSDQRATASELERLRQLENPDRDSPTRAHTDKPHPVGPAAGLAQDERDAPRSDPQTERRSRRRWWLPLGVGLIAGLVGLGIGTGVPALTGQVTPLSAPNELPEFAFTQTDEDVLQWFAPDVSGVDPESTRYVARIRGYEVFIARQVSDGGICVITFQFDADPSETSSVGCASAEGGNADEFGMAVGVDETLDIVVGQLGIEVSGTPVHLSASVNAYLR